MFLPVFSQANDDKFDGDEDRFRQAPLQLKKSRTPIKIDGIINEEAWFKGNHAEGFWEYYPTDTLRADWQTEIYMTYDENNLYIAAKCYSKHSNYIAHSLRRDFQSSGNDNITFVLDPFNDHTNAFLFGISPFGVTREGLISGGGRSSRSDWDISWENKWTGAAGVEDGYWTAEVAIPFSTLRYSEGSKTWNFNAYRFDTYSNIRSTWTRIPMGQSVINLSFMGKMHFEEPLKKPGANISFIPYVIAGNTKDYDAENQPANSNFNIGGDVKVGISSGLNLDLTVNPDFSQVEVDEQVTNLDRFELFFPERRRFFLENADLFGNFGNSRINPFFSRRIGLKNGQEIPILAGARLSGKIDDNWRIGLLNMQTGPEKDLEDPEPSFNYLVTALQRRTGKQSNLGLIFVNKQTFENLEEQEFLGNEFNRVFGLDYNLATANNRWSGKVFMHHSMSPEDSKQPFAHGTQLNYRSRNLSASWDHQWVGEEYNAEVGFVPRKNFFRINPEIRYSFFPENPKINQHGPGLETRFYWSPETGKTDHELQLSYRVTFRNGARLFTWLENNYTYLTDDFNPTRKGDAFLPAETDYSYTSFNIYYSSDRRKNVYMTLRPSIGQFFNGKRYAMNGSLTYRYRQYGSLSMDLSYNRVELPAPFEPADLFLIGPKIDMTFSRSLFFTTFIQYNNQIDNININSRFQWRFAPLSDLYIVYTDNYYSTDFSVKNRAIVAKFTYWLNT